MDRLRPAVIGDCNSSRPSRGRLGGTTRGAIESLYDRLCRNPPDEGGLLKDEPSGVTSNGMIAVEPEVAGRGLGSGVCTPGGRGRAGGGCCRAAIVEPDLPPDRTGADARPVASTRRVFLAAPQVLQRSHTVAQRLHGSTYAGTVSKPVGGEVRIACWARSRVLRQAG